MLKGIVKFFNYNKGFGFVTPDNGDHDVFVGARVLDASGVSDLREGDRVEFEVGEDRSGRQAIVEIELVDQ